jgi:hypothetical protein
MRDVGGARGDSRREAQGSGQSRRVIDTERADGPEVEPEGESLVATVRFRPGDDHDDHCEPVSDRWIAAE